MPLVRHKIKRYGWGPTPPINATICTPRRSRA